MSNNNKSHHPSSIVSMSIPLRFLLLLLLTCLYRIINALLIQTQFDPDEYWQTLEPAYCEAYNNNKNNNNNCAYTWEWQRRRRAKDDYDDNVVSSQNIIYDFIDLSFKGPVRTYLSIVPTFMFYLLVKYFHIDTNFMISKGPMILHTFLVVIPTDICIYIMASIIVSTTTTFTTTNTTTTSLQLQLQHQQLPFWCLLCSLTSWFHGYALIRTYSNSIETVLLVTGMTLVSPELFLGGSSSSSNSQDKEPNENPLLLLRKYPFILRSSIAFVLGGMSVSIRFTSLAAWVPIGIILALQQQQQQQQQQERKQRLSLMRSSFISYILYPCTTCSLIGLCISFAVDRYFYNFWTIPFLGNIYFNVIEGNGSLYGTHPLHWYVSSGIPAITGVMLPFVLYDLYDLLLRNRRRIVVVRNNKKWRRNIWIIILSYTIMHSISSHKEFRFLLPILPLMCLLAGNTMIQFIEGCYDNNNSNNDTNSTTTTSTMIVDNRMNQNNKFQRRRCYILVFFLIVLNYPHLLYLGLIHQRSPISVNKHIVDIITTLEQQQQQQKDTHQQEEEHHQTTTRRRRRAYSIHYLMGCHSTPLYTHLHIPYSSSFLNSKTTTIFYDDIWTLDCSPSCRILKNCESENFSTDPFSFVQDTYYSYYADDNNNDNNVCQEEEEENEVVEESNNNENNDDITLTRRKTCQEERDYIDNNNGNDPRGRRSKRTLPDFLVIFVSDLSKIKQKEEQQSDETNKVNSSIFKDYKEVGRFIYGINGIKIGNILRIGDDFVNQVDVEEKNSNSDDKKRDEHNESRQANIKNNNMYRHLKLFNGIIEISLDDMILLLKEEKSDK